MKGSMAYFGILVLLAGVITAEIFLAPRQTIHIQSSGSLQSQSGTTSLSIKKYTYGLDSHRSKVLQALVKIR